MEFLKKNYEKVLLALVLLGLIAAVGWLLIWIPEKREDLKALRVKKLATKVPALPPLDLKVENDAIARAKSPPRLDFTTKHNLFNPVLWQKTPGGQLLKVQSGNEIGPGAVVVDEIRPLYLKVAFNSYNGSGYLLDITQETAARESDRQIARVVSSENKSDILTLTKVNGAEDKPTSLELVWKKTGEAIVVSPDKPFQRVDGYTADIKYPPEPNAQWTGVRNVDQRNSPTILRFGGGEYIVAIHKDDVTLLDRSNNKKTTITFHSTTEKR